MKLKLVLIIPLLLTVYFIYTPMVGAPKSPIINVSTSEIYLIAGQENIINIELTNTGDNSVFDVEAFLTSTTPGVTILSKAHQVYSEIKERRFHKKKSDVKRRAKQKAIARRNKREQKEKKNTN